MHAIVAEGLEKRYGAVQALAGLSFRVGEGEVFGLLGPNGAGKSTTTRILVTLTKPDAGQAVVAGHDSSGAGAGAARDRLHPPGLGRRPGRHRPREPRPPGARARPTS